MATMKKVQPRLLKGMRDFLPERMILRQWLIDSFRGVFERFGFEPLETPTMEYAETLTGKFGEEGERLMYRFVDHGGREVALRYDLTVPFTRVVAQYPELPRPFKRYHIAPVFRAENPQKGRYREFYQCDFDTAGSASPMADAETISVVAALLDSIGFRRYQVKLNNRKILIALAESAGVPAEQHVHALRAIDKLDKIGVERVRDEMLRHTIEPAVADRLLSLVAIRGDARLMLTELRGRLGESAIGRDGIDELLTVVECLDAAGVSPEVYSVDFAMVRGMDYYTGPIYEVAVDEPKIGSISGGGRYDKLIGMFTGQDLPATGGSIGMERIIDVIEELGLRPAHLGRTVTQALVTVFGPETQAASIRLATELRAAGIRAELFLGSGALGRQLRYADQKGIRLALIAGPDEIARGDVTLKNLLTQDQRTAPWAEIVAIAQAELAGAG